MAEPETALVQIQRLIYRDTSLVDPHGNSRVACGDRNWIGRTVDIRGASRRLRKRHDRWQRRGLDMTFSEDNCQSSVDAFMCFIYHGQYDTRCTNSEKCHTCPSNSHRQAILSHRLNYIFAQKHRFRAFRELCKKKFIKALNRSTLDTKQWLFDEQENNERRGERRLRNALRLHFGLEPLPPLRNVEEDSEDEDGSERGNEGGDSDSDCGSDDDDVDEGFGDDEVLYGGAQPAPGNAAPLPPAPQGPFHVDDDDNDDDDNDDEESDDDLFVRRSNVGHNGGLGHQQCPPSSSPGPDLDDDDFGVPPSGGGGAGVLGARMPGGWPSIENCNISNYFRRSSNRGGEAGTGSRRPFENTQPEQGRDAKRPRTGSIQPTQNDGIRPIKRESSPLIDPAKTGKVIDLTGEDDYSPEQLDKTFESSKTAAEEKDRKDSQQLQEAILESLHNAAEEKDRHDSDLREAIRRSLVPEACPPTSTIHRLRCPHCENFFEAALEPNSTYEHKCPPGPEVSEHSALQSTFAWTTRYSDRKSRSK